MKKQILKLLCASITLAMAANMAMAEDGTWNSGSGPRNWGNDTKWLDNKVADGVGATATFDRSTTGGSQFAIDGNYTIGSLVITNSTATGREMTFTVNQDCSMTIDAGEGKTALIVNNGGGALILNSTISGAAPWKILSDTKLENLTSNGSQLQVKGDIVSGNNSTNLQLILAATNDRIHISDSIRGNITVVVTQTGNEWVNLNKASDYTGGTIITSGGKARAYSNEAFGSGSITFRDSGAILGLEFNGTSNSGTSVANNIIIEGSDATISTPGNYVGATLTGAISGDGQLILAPNTGAHEQRAIQITGNNTYKGGTLVNGILYVNNTEGSGTGSGNVTVATNAKLGGSGRVGASVITQGIATLQVGYGLDAGFTIGDGLTLGGDLTITYGDVVGLLTIVGQLDLAGNTITFELDGYTEGETELLRFAGLDNGDINSFSFNGTGWDGYTLQLTATGISIVAVPEPGTYAVFMAAVALAFIFIRRRRE